MSSIDNAVNFAVGIAEDDSHGYSQINRDGDPDYDCSSLVIDAYKQAGYNVADASYTGDMYNIFTANRQFYDVTDLIDLPTGEGLQRGDILLKPDSHTAIYIGDGQIVHASIDEAGTIYGRKKGDQTGREICTRSYYNKPWTYVLRPIDLMEVINVFKFDDIEEGSQNCSVLALAEILVARGYISRDTFNDVINRNFLFTADLKSGLMDYQQVRIQQGQQIGTDGKPDGQCYHATWADLLGLAEVS